MSGVIAELAAGDDVADGVERAARALLAAIGAGGVAMIDLDGHVLAAAGDLAAVGHDDALAKRCVGADERYSGRDRVLAWPLYAGGRRVGTLIVHPAAAVAVDELEACAPTLGLALALYATETSRAQFRRHALRAQEEERARIARELHDGIGQALTALLVGLRTLDSMLPESSDCAPARDLVQHLAVTAVNTLDEAGCLARGLRPSVLDDVGLTAALEHYLADFSRTYGVDAFLHAPGLEEERLPPEFETAIYRLVQEALTNVAKHAHATTASVIVERRNGEVSVIVEDDGRGMRARSSSELTPAAFGRLGLVGLRERVALLDGTVAVESVPGRGATIYARLPLVRRGR